MSPQKRTSFQNRWKESQKEESREAFFGRGDEVTRFRETLAQPGEKRSQFFFNVFGQGGVGKTFLLRQFQQIVDDQKGLSAWSNDGQRNIIEVMAQFSDDLRSKGVTLKSFDDRLRTYRQKRAELEADPEVPATFFEFLGQTAIKAGLWAGAHALGAPAVGANILIPFIKADELATKVGEGFAFVARKLKKDEVQLLQDPIAVLTPIWLEDLRDACEQHSIVLFLDAYEHTAEYLDEWLRDVVQGGYGDTSLNLILVIAGQLALSWEAWSEYERFISRMPLNSFTEDETKAFLKKKGMIDDQVATDVFRKTRGLPVLVALLTSIRSGERMPIDPHETAIEHFLKRVEPRQRQVALDAALPKRLNRDVLAELIGTEHADALFSWLKRMPFVQRRAEGWEYHPVVRHLMMAYKRQESPEGWAGLHRRLGDYSERLQKNLGLPETRQIQDAVWREHALTILYHRVCENPHRFLGLALNGFLSAIKFQRAFAREWAELLQKAEEDTDSPEALRWGARLVTALKAIEDRKPSEAIEAFTVLLTRDDLEKKQRAVALSLRSYLHRNIRHLKEALEDLSAAIDLAQDDDEYLADRGLLYFFLQRYDDALVDLNRAAGLNPDAFKILTARIMVLLAMNRIDEADADLKRVMHASRESHLIVLYQLMVAMRRGDPSQVAEVYTRLSDHLPKVVDILREALRHQPLETALEESSSFTLLLGMPPDLSASYAQQYKSLLIELDQGNSAPFIKSIQSNAAAIKAVAHREKAELEDALVAIDQAIQVDPAEMQYLLARAELKEQMGRREEALADIDKAVVLAPCSADVFHRRGALQLSLGRIPQAFESYSKAIELEPTPWRLHMRGVLHRLEGRYPEALADLERAMVLQPNDMLLAFCRLPLHFHMNDMEAIISTCAHLAKHAPLLVQQLKDSVAGPDPEQHPSKIQNWLASTGLLPALVPEWTERWTSIVCMDVDAGACAVEAEAASIKARVHRQKAEFQESLAAIDNAMTLEPKYLLHRLERAETYRQMGRIEDALSDVRHIQTLQLDSARVQLACANLYLQMNQSQDAVAAANQALTLDPKMTMARVMRSTALTHGGRHREALEEISRAIEQEPELSLALSVRSVLYIVHERYEDALKDMEKIAARDSTFINGWPNMRGEMLSRLGKYDEAMENYRQALAKEPANWRAAYNLAVTRAYLEGPAAVENDLADAMGRLQTLLATNRPAALVRLGGIEALTDSTDRAFELLKEAISLDPILIHWAKGDLAWLRLREDPRFQALLR